MGCIPFSGTERWSAVCLICPHLSAPSTTQPILILFHFQRNIVSHSLEYLSRDDRKIKVKAISLLSGNRKLEKELGDPDGETHTLHYFGIESEAEIKRLAENDLEKMTVEGYKGGFTAFGTPFVRHGDTVEIRDDEYPERVGRYFTDATRTTFG